MRRVASRDFSNPQIYTNQYNQFLGCHFSADPSACHAAYSPDCLNMIPDASGFPEKRPGWRIIANVGSGRVRGIHFLEKDDKIYSLAVVDSSLLLYEGYFETALGTEIIHDDTTGKTFSVAYDGKLFLFTGKTMFMWTGDRIVGCNLGSNDYWMLRDLIPELYVPTTTINSPPSGGGDTYQKVNLLTGWRINTFAADGKADSFKLDGTVDSYTNASAWYTDTGVEIPVASISGDTVRFSVIPSAASIAGTANISVAFCHTVSGSLDTIMQCRFGTLYGYNTHNRIFVSGNKNYKNRIWYTENNSPLYFADTNYIDIGISNFPVVGFHKTLAGELAVLKETNEMESCIWHVSAEMSNGGEDDTIQGSYFPVREGISGTGAINPFCQQTLRNDVLFLSEQGVFDLKTSYSNSRFISQVQSRSDSINFKLIEDAKTVGMNSAFSLKWRSNYLLFINGHVYVMTDSRNWFYWDNFDFICGAVHRDNMFFGDSNGHICRLNCDMVADGSLLMDAFSDGAEQVSDNMLDLRGGYPIVARWSSHISVDGDLFRKKDLQKNGFGVYVKNYSKTSCDVYIKSLDSSRRMVKSKEEFSFDFNNLDFSDLSFMSMPSFRALVRCRLRGYAALQIVVENAKLNEAFGIFLIQYNYLIGNHFRR